MSWEGGVDLVGFHGAAETPNIIVHVARMVHTPVGSSPAGMILIQPDPTAEPTLMGFISRNLDVASYFGPRIFARTPFENAPALEAEITIENDEVAATARIEVAGHIIETSLGELGSTESIQRPPCPQTPFTQMCLEANAGACGFSIDGTSLELVVPEIGISGGFGAVYSAIGLYAR